MNFHQRVFEIVKRVPAGQVATYGQIARLLGNPRASRMVGYALHRNPEQGVIPCHRVVFRDGALCTGYVFGGEDVQRHMLAAEGVTFMPDGRVDMDKHQWA